MKALVLSAKWEPKEGIKLSEYERRTKNVYSSTDVWRYPELKIQDIPKPDVGPKDVLVHVKACGVCGSDVHLSEADENGYMLYSSLARMPVVIGHEYAGVVEAVGKDVKYFKEGDLAAVEGLFPCGECVNCKNGFPNHCMYIKLPGFTVNGGFAEYFAAEERYLSRITDLIDVYGSEDKACEAGALIEPTGVSYNCMFVRGEGFLPGAYVSVYGTGSIGLAAVALARQAGASKIIAFEPKEERMKLAKEIGADYVFNPFDLEKEGSSAPEKVLELTGGEGADVHIEASGDPERVIPWAQASMAVNGKIMAVGKAVRKVPTYLEGLQIKRAKFLASEGNVGHGIWQNVARLMAAGKIDMTRIVTNRYPLDKAAEAIHESAEGKGGKTIVKM